MAEVVATNGTHTPETPRPSHASLSLTEYSANPSPPCATPRERVEHAGVPADYLLPTGYPDVSNELVNPPISPHVQIIPYPVEHSNLTGDSTSVSS